jgi:hypothetical protein
MGIVEESEKIGIREMMQLSKDEFPDLKFGYFNPPMERIRGDFEMDLAQ